LRAVIDKPQAAMTSEWDALAKLRIFQIESGADLTYRHFLCPNIVRLCGSLSASNVLDIGCGVGVLARELGNIAKTVIGIDPSAESIRIADSQCKASNVAFLQATMETMATEGLRTFDVLLLNMTMACAPGLSALLRAARKSATGNARLIFSLPHPCFWPSYYGYAADPQFAYGKELMIEAPFRISKDATNGLISTHIHRPLEMYFKTLHETGWRVVEFCEPMPDAAIQILYPAPWKAPRYLFGVCRPLQLQSDALF
jgi:SAM-dependent methyltransferase